MIPERALAGRTALITGGGTGLGLALAPELGAAGARLVMDGGAWLGRGFLGHDAAEGLPSVRRRRRSDGEG